MPPRYAGFAVVVMAGEVQDPHSFSSLAVKLPLDDVTSWTRHALLRAAAWNRLRSQPCERATLPPVTSTGPLPPSTPATQSNGQAARVVAALLRYGRSRPAEDSGVALDFTADKAAIEFVRSDPFAFLWAVIFDQGTRRRVVQLDLTRRSTGPLKARRMCRICCSYRLAATAGPMVCRVGCGRHCYTESLANDVDA